MKKLMKRTATMMLSGTVIMGTVFGSGCNLQNPIIQVAYAKEKSSSENANLTSGTSQSVTVYTGEGQQKHTRKFSIGIKSSQVTSMAFHTKTAADAILLLLQ